MNGTGIGIIIPVVAIAATFSVPIVAIIADYKRRKLIAEERRAMIDKGMVPPPLHETPYGAGFSDPLRQREKSLHSGVTLSLLGVGLAVASWLLASVITQSFIPRQVSGPMAVGAAVLGSLGIGNLIYYAVTRNKARARSD
jgi:hypothetical protein